MKSHWTQQSDGRGLWAAFWRMLLIAPLAPLGLAALVIVLGLSWVLPITAVFWAIEGHYVYGALMLISWVVWLRYGRPIRRRVFEGFEHGSI